MYRLQNRPKGGAENNIGVFEKRNPPKSHYGIGRQGPLPRKDIAVHVSLSSIQIVKEQTATTVPADRTISQPPEAHRPCRACLWNMKKAERKSARAPPSVRAVYMQATPACQHPRPAIRDIFAAHKKAPWNIVAELVYWDAPGRFQGGTVCRRFRWPAAVATKRTHSHGMEATRGDNSQNAKGR